MIGTVIRVGWLSLRRDRVAQAMTFVLPIAFFSIFAIVFGGSGNQPTPRVSVAVVDEDHTPTSERLVAALKAESGLRVTTARKEGDREVALDREHARAMVRQGDVPIAVILPKGLGAGNLWMGSGDVEVELLADPSDPVAPQMVQGLLQKAAMSSMGDIVMKDGISAFEKYAGPLTPEQQAAVDGWLPSVGPGGEGGADAKPTGLDRGLIPTKTVDVIRAAGGNRPIIAFYAAGIGVMWLLFTCAAAGGALIDEQDTGTLERLLSSRLGMTRLLAGKWLWVTLLGFVQLVVMFVFGWLVFGVDLPGHVPGFVVVTAITSAAGAALGLVLAALARTRAQLSGLSTIVILVMSALGGSMFPRFLMPEFLKTAGLATFNGWALDAYQKVFWRDQPITALWPQLVVLLAMTVAFLAITRVMARRWERA